ncbi:MAG: four helix bundle protein [Leeuwenhoekiella sp.]|nr:MAG: four helix bundle protein [Leeuwenhoekiella sp.]
MGNIQRFEDLEIWQKARALNQNLFRLISDTQLQKDFKLREQINGAAGSIMDNIAEGFERDGNKEFAQFLSIAKGSCGEVRSQLYRCYDREYIDQDQFNELKNQCSSLSRQINALMKYLKSSDRRGSKFD